MGSSCSSETAQRVQTIAVAFAHAGRRCRATGPWRPLARASAGQDRTSSVWRRPSATTDGSRSSGSSTDATDTARCAGRSTEPRSRLTISWTRSQQRLEELDRDAAQAVVAGRGRGGCAADRVPGWAGRRCLAAPAPAGRRRAARILNGGPVPVTTLRAATIVAPGARRSRRSLRSLERCRGDDLPALGLCRDPTGSGRRLLGVLVGVSKSSASDQVFILGGPEVDDLRTMTERLHGPRQHPILIGSLP